MCGVFGYVGDQIDVGTAVVTALKTLEYRGYDSWGLAISRAGEVLLEKDAGRLNGHRHPFPMSSLGLGHTRWATHGGVTAANAHPHLDCARRIAVVHNGIIENHAELRADLVNRGHCFSSQTDSEVAAHLIEERLAAGSSLAESVSSAFGQLRGYNALVVMDAKSEQLAAIKHVSPLVIGAGNTGATIASDAVALLGHADRLIHLGDGHVAILGRERLEILDRITLDRVVPIVVTADRTRNNPGLAGYPDFLSKEVAEQPHVLRQLIASGRLGIELLVEEMRAASRILFTGCGSAGHAALAGTYLLAEIAGVDASFVPASELSYRGIAMDARTLVIALSQSGETIDVIEAMMEARSRGARLAALVNTPHSTLHRIVNTSVPLQAGVEQCVLATKSYTAMLAALLLSAYALERQWSAGVARIEQSANAIESILEPASCAPIRGIGEELAQAEHLFVIGRGPHYPSALEAALKIKEVSYVHAEGFAAGELKHGVIALIEPGTPCLVLAPDDRTRDDVLSGASELKSRGGHMIGIGTTDDAIFDRFIPVLDAGTANPIVEAVPGQLLGYYAALKRGADPDRPRNLAKSVTVK